MSVDDYLNLAWGKCIAGNPFAETRELLHAAAQAWIPVVAEYDFSLRTQVDDGLSPNLVKELVANFDGKIISRDGMFSQVRWRSRPQPDHFEFMKALACAAISGDRVLARKLARGYRMLELNQYTAPFEIRDAVLQLLLAERESEAKQFEKLLKPGYAADFPQDLVEFPLGIIRNDSKLLIAGMKAVNTRFNTRWNEAKYRKQFQSRDGKQPSLAYPTVDVYLDRVRSQLLALHWQWSTWAMAFLNIARWCGMNDVFNERTLFSTWIPFELSGGEDRPSTAPAKIARKSRPCSPRKRKAL